MGTGDAGATRPGEVVTTGTEGALTPQAARTAAKLMPPPSVSTARRVGAAPTCSDGSGTSLMLMASPLSRYGGRCLRVPGGIITLA
jgi:hypothetical protein